jgi:hypothetical protein
MTALLNKKFKVVDTIAPVNDKAAGIHFTSSNPHNPSILTIPFLYLPYPICNVSVMYL